MTWLWIGLGLAVLLLVPRLCRWISSLELTQQAEAPQQPSHLEPEEWRP